MRLCVSGVMVYDQTFVLQQIWRATKQSKI